MAWRTIFKRRKTSENGVGLVGDVAGIASLVLKGAVGDFLHGRNAT